MKSQPLNFLLAMMLLSVALAAPLHAQTTGFTYQGQLLEDGQPVTGLYDLSFHLFNAPTNGTEAVTALGFSSWPVTNGLFTVELDFGLNAFSGQPRWLQIDAKSAQDTVWDQLWPRQRLTPTPYAIHALTADASGLSGTIASSNLGPLTVDNTVLAGNSVDSLKIVDGSIVASDVDAASFSGTFWKADGNAGTIPGIDFLGTTDNQPLEFQVNNSRALRLEPSAEGAPNVIGGAPINYVDAGIVGATISGGGVISDKFFLGPGPNHVSAIFGTIGGGRLNTVAGEHATIGGGLANTAEATAHDSVIGGGLQNTAENNALRSVIGGGERNHVADRYTTIGGGALNAIGANSPSAVISGGYQNRIEPDTFDATIGGGARNVIGSGAPNATIAGGGAHWATGLSATIGGGYANRALAIDATVGGGYTNTASGYRSTISGGAYNLTSSGWATVSGGQQNRVEGDYATIGGGQANLIESSANASTVSGGYLNQIENDTYLATVSGGERNAIRFDANYGTIAGGFQNTIQSSAQYSSLGGGCQNIIQNYSYYSGIDGGYNNTIESSSWYGSIGGGRANAIETHTAFATIGGGDGNKIGTTADSATIGGGRKNTIQVHAYNTFIGGGEDNTIQTNALWTVIGGGRTNTIQAEASYSTISGGRYNKINHDSGFGAIGGGVGNTIDYVVEYGTVGGGYYNKIHTVCHAATIGGGLHNNIGQYSFYSTIGGGFSNTNSEYSEFGTISGGRNNTVASVASYATIGGGRLNTIQHAAGTIPGGIGAQTGSFGQYVHASGFFTNSSGSNQYGSAQASQFILRGTTVGSTSFSELFLDGASERMNVPVGATWAFEILMVYRSQDVPNSTTSSPASGAFKITGIVENASGSTKIVGSSPVPVVFLGGDLSKPTVIVEANDSVDALVIRVKSSFETTFRWVATVRTSEVSFPQ